MNNIRVALETALDDMTPALLTAWENVPFDPDCDVPYQKVNLLMAQPSNSEFGPNYTEQGIFQITLMYPELTGAAAAEARAALIKETFKRGATFASGGVVVVIDKTPEVSTGINDNDRWALPVRIRWFAHVTQS